MSAELNRLRWRCQRGMLELDHILGRFLDRHHAAAPSAVRAAFDDLLAMEDPDIMDLLMDRRSTSCDGMAELLTLLRQRC